jgi:NAD(P)-dependent dehydrogenase (short-subunit alcohol dehydrogenase family)
MSHHRVALIIGAGPGISGSFAKLLRLKGYTVAIASRNMEKLSALAQAIDCHPFLVDASSPESIVQLFEAVERQLGSPEVVLYNPSKRTRGDILSIPPDQVASDLQVTAVGAFAVAQEAARRMLPKHHGSIFFTGATAGVKAFPNSSVFAMGKFALRGLAQSLAKELGPQGIHVAHFVIDGWVRIVDESSTFDPETTFTSDNIAQTYYSILEQPKGAWTWEIELRSMTESF